LKAKEGGRKVFCILEQLFKRGDVINKSRFGDGKKGSQKKTPPKKGEKAKKNTKRVGAPLMRWEIRPTDSVYESNELIGGGGEKEKRRRGGFRGRAMFLSSCDSFPIGMRKNGSPLAV